MSVAIVAIPLDRNTYPRVGEPGHSLAGIAAELGYADQSHLIRDFRATLGRPPPRLARAG